MKHKKLTALLLTAAMVLTTLTTPLTSEARDIDWEKYKQPTENMDTHTWGISWLSDFEIKMIQDENDYRISKGSNAITTFRSGDALAKKVCEKYHDTVIACTDIPNRTLLEKQSYDLIKESGIKYNKVYSYNSRSFFEDLSDWFNTRNYNRKVEATDSEFKELRDTKKTLSATHLCVNHLYDAEGYVNTHSARHAVDNDFYAMITMDGCTLSNLSLYQVPTSVEPGTKADDLKFFVRAKCSHGYSYAPVSSKMISGYNSKTGDLSKAVVTFNGTKLKVSDYVTPTKITLNTTRKTLVKGKTLQLSVKSVTPSHASKAVKWTTSKKSVATVDSSGKVTAKKKGTATITATSKKDSKIKATCKITVKNK